MEQNGYASGAGRAGRKLLAWLMVMILAASLCLGVTPGIAAAEDETSTEDTTEIEESDGTEEGAESSENVENTADETTGSDTTGDATSSTAANDATDDTTGGESDGSTTETEAESETITVALTVVDTSGDEIDVVYNAAVSGLTTENTVADMLAAAGFTEADSLEATADGTSYYDSWSCPYFLGKGYDSTTGYYWVTMYEGESANYASAYLTSTLQDGGHYQYIYADYSVSTFDYDDYGLTDPLATDESSSETITVALTIVDTTDSENGVIYNAAVTISSGSTVADLLATAGFTEVSTADETLSSDSYYYNSYGSPTFRGNKTSQDNDGNWTYWSTMYEGNSANYASASLTSTLVDGGHYQYIYGSSSTFSYDDEITDPLAETDSDTDTETETEAAVNIYDEDKTATLLENLIERFSDGGSDEAISNSTVYAAIALNSLGLGDQIDADAIIESLESYEETYGSSISAGTLAKYIMALTAAGVDCTDVEVTLGGETVTDLVAYMEDLVTDSENAYSAVFILAIYDYGGYETENSDEIISDMIDVILENTSDGLVGGSGYYDTETTAQAILALLPYTDDGEVAAFLEEAEAALLAYQNEDGGFDYDSYSTSSNLDATAYIVAALTALGYDCAEGTALTTENGSTPIGYLVAMADSTLDGYDENSSYDESMTSATVLLALAAWKGDQATSFNVYEAQDVVRSEDSDADTAATTEETEEASEDSLAETGDYSLTAAMVLAAAGMLAAGAGVTRRRRALADGVEGDSNRQRTRRHTTDRR